MHDTNYFMEPQCPGIDLRFKVDRMLYENRTKHQHLAIFENKVFGKVMVLDGVVQTTTADEFVYHEMLAHVPIVAHGAVRRVLIIGGGDGGILRRCLDHRSIEKVTMVELDPGVVELSTTWLPEISAGAFDDPRAELVFDDGCKFVKAAQNTYDVIIVDSTDPVGPGAVLFAEEFFADCRKCLTPGGLLVNQNGAPPFLKSDHLRTTHQRLKTLFKDAWYFVAPVPEFFGGFTAFAWASDNEALRVHPVAEIEKRYAASGFKTRYYNPGIHVASFALPQFMVEAMGEGS